MSEATEEKEQEKFDEVYAEAVSCIQTELPGVEYELRGDVEGLYLWVPYVAETDEGLEDRGYEVGTVYFTKEDPETHSFDYMSKEEIYQSVKELRKNFIKELSQICSAVNRFLEAEKREEKSDE